VLNAALFISGSGTTMGAILDAISHGALSGVTPRLVVASKPEIGGIAIAKHYGIPNKDIKVITPGPGFGSRLLRACTKREVNFIGQYGWLPKTPPEVVEHFKASIVNQHPGPLDPKAPPGFDFGGKGMFGRRVMAARLLFTRRVGRDAWTMAVAHCVSSEFDRGEVLGEKMVHIYPETTVDMLKSRLLAAEHFLQIQVLHDFANGALRPIEHQAHWLVKPHELSILEECKKEAAEMYPEG